MQDAEIVSAASLVKTKRKLTPSTMTSITQAQIQQSGARDLFELMDIFVPNFQYVSDDTQPRHMGLRGIMSNRDDKYMLLVNGRIMNEKTDFGAFSERDLPMLSDIHHIDVVRGPGSGLHGPGALAMVISIVTENAETFQGTETTVKGGVNESFQSYEFKHGMELPNGAGLYGYVGVAEYPGAAQDEASAFFGREWSVNWDGSGSRTYGAGESVNEGLARYNEAYLGQPKWKGHLEYTQGGFDVWARHTNGGEYFTNPYSEGEAAGYQQDTVYAKYDQTVNDQFSIAYSLSFDQTGIEEPESTMYRKQYAEQEIVGRILAQWQPSIEHTFALGSEWSYETLGLDYQGEALHTNNAIAGSWNTNMASVFGEHQWAINDKWHMFLGGRLDKHSYTDTLVSPRGTLIYMPTKRDTIKLIAARSVRTNLAYWTREEHTTIGGKSTPETLKSIELRYERLYSENTLFGASLFYHDHDLIEWNWNPQIWRQALIGNVQSYGAEVEASYRLKETRIDLSHSYTKMGSYDLYPDPIDPSQLPYQRHSSSPYGYGDDFASWASHTTKVAVHRPLTEQWALDASAYAYWGYEGREAFAEYRADDIGTSEVAQDALYRPSIFVNLGLEYQPRKTLALRIDGHNLLGWLDPDFNKRMSLAHRWVPGFYRQQPVAVTVSLRYKFQ